jgi:hypothetical protein
MWPARTIGIQSYGIVEHLLTSRCIGRSYPHPLHLNSPPPPRARTHTHTHTHARTYGVNSKCAQKLTHWLHRLRSFSDLGGNVVYRRHDERQTNSRGLNNSLHDRHSYPERVPILHHYEVSTFGRCNVTSFNYGLYRNQNRTKYSCRRRQTYGLDGTEALKHNSHIALCTADCSFQIIHSDTGLNYKYW